VIETQGLSRRFGAFVAVEDVTLSVRAGEVFGFLGPNGAGKTTVMRILCGLIAPSSGSARVVGCDVRKDGATIRRRVGLLTESPGLYRKLSAEDNLRYFAKLYGVPDPAPAIRQHLTALGLYERRHDPVGSFSKGMTQKVAIARALLHDPELVFLDEPSSGLDPEAVRLVHDFILALKERGKTVFLCTHHLDEAERLCDRVAVFKRKLIAVDTPERLRENRFGVKTHIVLAERSDSLQHEVARLPFVRGVQWRDTTLVVTLTDPESQNPELVRKVVGLGGAVRRVTEERASLEQAYLSLTGSLRLE
jgi:ABC-2 type transport system ATP-binding protein